MHFSFYWVDIMIGFTSKINSLGTNERLFYFSFNCKFKSLKWIWQITPIGEEYCGRKARFPKILENPSNTGNKSQIQLVEPCVSPRTLFFFSLKTRGKKKREINHRTPVNSCPVVFLPGRQSCLSSANCSEHSQREPGKRVFPREPRKQPPRLCPPCMS